MKVTPQKKQKIYKTFPCIALSGLALFGLQACGDDGASAEKESDFVSKLDDDPLSSAVTSADSQSSDSQAQTNSSGSTNNQQTAGSSSSKTATVSSDEILNDAKKVVTGTCAPSTPNINKGELATWKFYRAGGDVFDAIMAPFVWKFPELEKTIQGNGYDKVDIEYPDAGTYTATLNVDGTEISCEPLQVQGVPIVIESCKAEKPNANAGEAVTWTVTATSESKIVGYAWSYEGEAITGNGTSGTMTMGSDLHKVNVAPTVVVTNEDKTSQKYLCENVYVINPNKVDYTLTSGAEAIAIPTAEVWVVQLPEDGNTLVCEAKGSINVFINDEPLSEEPTTDYFGKSIAAYKGQKVQFLIQTNASTADCKVTPW